MVMPPLTEEYCPSVRTTVCVLTKAGNEFFRVEIVEMADAQIDAASQRRM